MKVVVPIHVVYTKHVDSHYPEFLAWFFNKEEAEEYASNFKEEYIQVFVEEVPGSR